MGVRPGAEAVLGRLLPAGTSLSDPPPVSASSLLALLLGLPETAQGLLCFPSLAWAPSLLFAIAWWPVCLPPCRERNKPQLGQLH